MKMATKANLWYDVFFHDELRHGFAKQRPQYFRWTRSGSDAWYTEDTDGHADPVALADSLESSLRDEWSLFAGREFRVRVYRTTRTKRGGVKIHGNESPLAERVFSIQ